LDWIGVEARKEILGECELAVWVKEERVKEEGKRHSRHHHHQPTNKQSHYKAASKRELSFHPLIIHLSKFFLVEERERES
jgi:hypothetical protein